MSNWHQVVWLILDGSLKILICFNPYPLNPKAAIPGSVSLCWANQHSWLSSTFLPFSEAQLSHSSSSKNESKRMPGFTAGSHWHSNNSSSLLLIPRPPHTFEYLGVFLYDHFSECEKQYCTVSPNDKKKNGQRFSEGIAPFPLSHILNLNCLYLVIGYIELSLAQNRRSLDFRH